MTTGNSNSKGRYHPHIKRENVKILVEELSKDTEINDVDAEIVILRTKLLEMVNNDDDDQISMIIQCIDSINRLIVSKARLIKLEQDGMGPRQIRNIFSQLQTIIEEECDITVGMAITERISEIEV